MLGEDESAVRNRLREWLAADFDLYEEASVRHALFNRRLRVDMLAIPRDPSMSDIAIAFETKADREWDIPTWSKALKQASDYVLASVQAGTPHDGKRVMATFVFPAPRWQHHHASAGVDGVYPSPEEIFLSGVAHMASYHRVGSAREVVWRDRTQLVLKVGDEVWDRRGWRTNARNILAGKRQIGSQRFPILDELKGLDR